MEKVEVEETEASVEQDMEKLRQKFIRGLKAHNAHYIPGWAENANMRKVDGTIYIQTEGHDVTFPKGTWEPIEKLISFL